MQINSGAIIEAALASCGGHAPTQYVATIFFVHHDGESTQFVWADNMSYLSDKVARAVANQNAELNPFRNIIAIDLLTNRVLRLNLLFSFYDDLQQQQITTDERTV